MTIAGRLLRPGRWPAQCDGMCGEVDDVLRGDAGADGAVAGKDIRAWYGAVRAAVPRPDRRASPCHEMRTQAAVAISSRYAGDRGVNRLLRTAHRTSTRHQAAGPSDPIQKPNGQGPLRPQSP